MEKLNFQNLYVYDSRSDYPIMHIRLSGNLIHTGVDFWLHRHYKVSKYFKTRFFESNLAFFSVKKYIIWHSFYNIIRNKKWIKNRQLKDEWRNRQLKNEWRNRQLKNEWRNMSSRVRKPEARKSNLKLSETLLYRTRE